MELTNIQLLRAVPPTPVTRDTISVELGLIRRIPIGSLLGDVSDSLLRERLQRLADLEWIAVTDDGLEEKYQRTPLGARQLFALVSDDYGQYSR